MYAFVCIYLLMRKKKNIEGFSTFYFYIFADLQRQEIWEEVTTGIKMKYFS